MSFHPDELGFIAAIVEHPDDDTVRLIYADWLDENGQESRAKFIRLHILAHHACLGKGRRELLSEHKENIFRKGIKSSQCNCAKCLKDAARKEWFANWSSWAGEPRRKFGFQYATPHSRKEYASWERGLLETTRCHPDQWIRHHQDFPTIRHVSLYQWPGKQSIASERIWILPMEFTGVQVDYAIPMDEMGPAIRKAMSEKWPHVTFHLPPNPTITGSIGALMISEYDS